MSKLGILGLAGLMAFVAAASGDDWPQFRGPARDGVSKETGLLKSWSKSGPKLLWTYKDAGVGYAGPAVVGDRLFLSGGRGADEFVFALDIKGDSPKQLWSAKIAPLFQWKGNSWNAGPNVTPTVAGQYIYALGGQGELLCTDLSGKEIWRKNLPKDFGGEVNPIGGGAEEPTPLGWGYAGAPLVHGGHVICSPGGKNGLLAALNAKTGELVWQSKEIAEQASYSSPVFAELDKVPQYIQVTNAGIFGVGVKDGKKLWSYFRSPAYDDVVIATPIVSDHLIFSTVGFAQGCDLIEVKATSTGLAAVKKFSNKAVENREGGVVHVDGYLYGYSENKGWFCMELKTGEMAWTEKQKLGRGSITYADGCFYCCAEKGGDVVLLDASPKGWKELGRFKLPAESKLRKASGGLWTHPVVANGKLFIRDQEMVFCFAVK